MRATGQGEWGSLLLNSPFCLSPPPAGVRVFPAFPREPRLPALRGQEICGSKVCPDGEVGSPGRAVPRGRGGLTEGHGDKMEATWAWSLS